MEQIWIWLQFSSIVRKIELEWSPSYYLIAIFASSIKMDRDLQKTAMIFSDHESQRTEINHSLSSGSKCTKDSIYENLT